MIVLTRLSLLPPDHWERNVELSQKIGHIVTQEDSGEDCNVGQERCETILKYSKCPVVILLHYQILVFSAHDARPQTKF